MAVRVLQSVKTKHCMYVGYKLEAESAPALWRVILVQWDNDYGDTVVRHIDYEWKWQNAAPQEHASVVLRILLRWQTVERQVINESMAAACMPWDRGRRPTAVMYGIVVFCFSCCRDCRVYGHLSRCVAWYCSRCVYLFYIIITYLL